MGALSLTASKPHRSGVSRRLVPGVTHVRYPDVYRGCEGGPQDAEAFALGCARLHRRQIVQNDSRSGRGRGNFRRAYPRRGRIRGCSYGLHAGVACGSATSTASCWWWTKSSVASAAPANGLRSSTPACILTSFACAKGIASGMPLGVTMSKAEVMDWIPGSHASTFGGNPVCIAAALATLDVIEKEGLLRNSQEVGDYMRKTHGGLAEEAQDSRRCSRARPDDWGRDRERSEDPRIRCQRSAIALSNWPSSAASCFLAAARARSHLAAADRHQGRSRRRHGRAWKSRSRRREKARKSLELKASGRRAMWNGTVESIHIASAAEGPTQALVRRG